LAGFASQSRSRRRALLVAIAVAMTVAAALAIGILLFGDFGGTEGRVLLTTVLLGVYGALAAPAAILWDQHRLTALAGALAGASSVAAAITIAGIWWNSDSETLGKATGTAACVLLPTVLAAALATRRRHRLYLPSVVLAFASAGMAIAAIWSETEQEAYFRVLGAAVVLTVLLVALQPLLLRTSEEAERPLRLVDDEGRTFEVVVRAGSVADAAARAIRELEREGRHVRSVELIGSR
jgi:MFS family permease